ncbi:MAG TPA: HAMP domain-containing protein, partial [Steroidobacteraceae bacterium]|nr:HAMP domain-containing protein [Steroidobacteraceae bacterium]
MNSLFLRVFLSFWLAMGLIVISGSALTAFVAWQRFGTIQAIEAVTVAEEASVPLRDGGLPAMQAWLRESELRNTGVTTYIVDMHGADILDRPLTERIERRVQRMGSLGYLADAEGHAPPLMRDPMRAYPQIVGPDGTVYTFFFAFPGYTLFGILGAPGVYLAVLFVAIGVSALACWWLARTLSRPVAQLQRSARALAAGNLEARVGDDLAQRKDELGVLARDFDQMAERVRSLLASKETLLRYVSHELRSPLARLRVALMLARREGADTQREMERIERETERLDTLIGQILRLSRLSTDDPSLVPQIVDVTQLVSEVVEDARMEAGGSEKGVEWTAGPIAHVRGSPELIRSAIENILRNAIRFTPRQASVDAALRIEGNSVLVTIRDRGPGVPQMELERIFEP